MFMKEKSKTKIMHCFRKAYMGTSHIRAFRALSTSYIIYLRPCKQFHP